MAEPAQPSLIFHKNTFFELTTGQYTLFIDPVFSRQRRGRRVADDVRECDYLFATSMTPWFDDVLDVLDECEATFVGLPRLTRFVSQELGLRKRRLLDLEPWERASDEGLRVTALPIWSSIGMERSIREGAEILRDVSKVFPDGPERLPFGRNARQMVDLGLRSVTQILSSVASLGGQSRAVGRMGEAFNVDLHRFTGGRPGLGYLFEIEGRPTIMHLADGVHGATDDEDLEDMADVCEPDVLVMHVGGRELDPYVRAVRVLAPRTVLLYRSRDPYTAGRRGQTLPMSQFVGAIEEDAPDVEVVNMRKGDTFPLDRANGKPAASGKSARLGLDTPAKTSSPPTKS